MTTLILLRALIYTMHRDFCSMKVRSLRSSLERAKRREALANEWLDGVRVETFGFLNLKPNCSQEVLDDAIKKRSRLIGMLL